FFEVARYQEALAEFERVKKIDPGNKDVYYVIGLTYFKMNQLEQAIEAYRQCTSGVYATQSQTNLKNLEKKVGKVNAK
ncbi:MAG TPA: tetratricopeptide repeat protein, partial [Blastocatellia bacterium]|nr:tetratricopeptide repeat protein [Blastocatellia bacterium]